jgi:hypothetical protein
MPRMFRPVTGATATRPAGLSMTADWSQVLWVSDAMNRVPAEERAAVRRELKPIGQSILEAARSNAAWSSRIPASLSMSTRFAGKNAGIVVQARAAMAPHARPLEGIATGGATFRHPVFGNTDRWVSQDARPFLAPAARQYQDAATAAAIAAVHEALRRAGVPTTT